MRAFSDLRRVLEDDDPEALAAKLRAFERIFVLVVGFEYWLRAVPKWGELATPYQGHLALATVLCAAALLDRWRRPAFLLLGIAHAVLVWREFPSTGNHAYLEAAFCLLAASIALEREEERRVYLGAVRWMIVVVLFASGLQKLAHGYWLGGEYLAFSLGGETYRGALGVLLPPEELARLSSLRGEVGDGPYRADGGLLPLVSNGTWILEMTLAPLLVWPRTRVAAAIAALALVLAIEVAAREVFFGLVFADALLLFLPGAANRRLVIPVLVLLTLLTLSRLGVLPEMTFY